MVKIKSLRHLLILVVLTACSTPQVQTYADNTLPDSQIARLTCAPYISVHAVDGDDQYRAVAGGGLWYSDCEIKLLPGQHTISVCYDESYSTGTFMIMDRCGGPVDVTFAAGKGATYRIQYEKSSQGWRPFISRSTGQKSNEQGVVVSTQTGDWYPANRHTWLEPGAYNTQGN